jgi:serine/threonine protein kinase
VPAAAAHSQRLAGYSLDEQIGHGGMAVVYRATDERLGRRVALKLLAPALAEDASFRQRFIRESRAAAAVDHPNIIPIYEAGETDGALFIAMRYVQGGDVRGLLEREKPLATDRVWSIISQVASALDAAHEHDLVHRDVKPGNMLLDASGGRGWSPAGQFEHVYLADFGISKMQLAAAALTQTGQFVGTLDYIAPEQIENKRIDGRADQYSLACAAFELLAGSRPFKKDTQFGLITAHLTDPPPPVTMRRPGLPPEVNQVLARAMAKGPAQRYATCSDFAADLGRGLGLLTGPPRQPGWAPSPTPPPRPRTEVAQPVPAPALAAAGLSSARQRPVTAGRPATAARPPGAGSGIGSWPPPPPTSTSTGKRPGRPRWVAAAIAVAAAVVIGGGVTAAIVLTHHAGPAPSPSTSLPAVSSPPASTHSSSPSPSHSSPSPSAAGSPTGNAAPPPPTTTATPTPSAAEAETQARAVDSLLNTGQDSSERLSGAETDAQNCASPRLADDVDQIRQVRDQRQTELIQAQALSTGALPDGATLKGNLVSALGLSLEADSYYLSWAQGQADPTTCVPGSQPREEPAADQRAHIPKNAFLRQWNGIAPQFGLRTRLISQM